MQRSSRVNLLLTGLLLVFWAVCWLTPVSRHQMEVDWALDTNTIGNSQYEVNNRDINWDMNSEAGVVMQMLTYTPKKLSRVADQYPRKAYITATALTLWYNQLILKDSNGPLSNPKWPAPVPTPTPIPVALAPTSNLSAAPGIDSPSLPGMSGTPLLRPEPAPSPIPSPTPSSPEELNQFLKLARRGQKLEPENAFFDVAAMCALKALKRDKEMERLLLVATRKNRYNRHNLDVVRTWVDCEALKYNYWPSDVPLWQKMQAYVEIPPMDSMSSHVIQHALENAIIARTKGESEHALKLADSTLRLCRLIRRESKSIFESGAIDKFELRAFGLWPGVYRIKNIPWATTSIKFQRTDPRALIYYARTHNRLDIANKAEREWNELMQWSRARPSYYQKYCELNVTPISARTLTLATIWKWPRHFLLLSVVPLLLLHGITIVFWSRQRKNYEGKQRKTFFLGTAIGTLILVVLNVGDAVVNQFNSHYLSTPSRFTDFWEQASINFYSTPRNYCSELIWYSPTFLLLCWAMVKAWPFKRELASQFWLFRRNLWPCYDGLTEFDPSPFINAALHDLKIGLLWLVKVGTPCALLLAFYVYVTHPEFRRDSYSGLAPLLLPVTLVVWRWCTWRWHMRRRIGQHASNWMQVVPKLALLSLGMLWATTLLWFALWQVDRHYRAEFDAEWNYLMTEGEVKYMRQKMNL